MDVRLVHITRRGKQKFFRIKKEITLLGRHVDCDLQVPVGDVSREHCQVIKEADKLLIRDLDSANGTFVNGKQITEIALKAGDQLSVGQITFVVQVDGQPEHIKLEAVGSGKAEPQQGQQGQSKNDDQTIALDSEVGLEEILGGSGGGKDMGEDILGESFFADLEDDDEEEGEDK